MIKNVLSDIGGVGLYGIISVCLFFIIFTTAIVWALLHKKSYCQTMSALPLDDGTVLNVKGDSDHD
jgi:hypothetical protein